MGRERDLGCFKKSTRTIHLHYLKLSSVLMNLTQLVLGKGLKHQDKFQKSRGITARKVVRPLKRVASPTIPEGAGAKVV